MIHYLLKRTLHPLLSLFHITVVAVPVRDTSPERFPKTCRGFFRRMYFFLLQNAYVWQGANEMRRKANEIKGKRLITVSLLLRCA